MHTGTSQDLHLYRPLGLCIRIRSIGRPCTLSGAQEVELAPVLSWPDLVQLDNNARRRPGVDSQGIVQL